MQAVVCHRTNTSEKVFPGTHQNQWLYLPPAYILLINPLTTLSYHILITIMEPVSL